MVQGEQAGEEIKFSVDLDFFRSPDGISQAVSKARELLGTNGSGSANGLQLNMVSLVARAETPHFKVKKIPEANTDVVSAQKGVRPVFLDPEKGLTEIPIYDRALLTHGHSLAGPALVESEQTTVLVSEGWQMTVDQFNNAFLTEVNAS